VSLLPERELKAVEAWFADLKEALGVSESADRGRVLASVRKLVADNESYNNEKRVVTAAFAYNRWGDLYTWAKEKLVAVPEVELPEVFNEPPNGWVFRPGGDYDKAQKRLVKTRLRVKELWAALDREVAADPTDSEWAESIKAQAVEEFIASTEAENFDKLCLAFVRGYEEEDPGEVWVEVAGEATATLELDADLPVEVVSELLSYAGETGVEAQRKVVEATRNRRNPARCWFDYLLTAYLYKNTRPDEQTVFEVGRLFREATDLLECFEEVSADDATLPSHFKKNRYDPTLTLKELTEAITKVTELKQGDLSGTLDDWKEAVKAAAAAVTDEKGVTTTA
jgi:hypothetical protein